LELNFVWKCRKKIWEWRKNSLSNLGDFLWILGDTSMESHNGIMHSCFFFILKREIWNIFIDPLLDAYFFISLENIVRNIFLETYFLENIVHNIFSENDF